MFQQYQVLKGFLFLLVVTSVLTLAPSIVLGQSIAQTDQQVEDNRPEESKSARSKREQRFKQKSQDLSLLMSRFMTGGGKEPVVFDSKAAREAGFNPKSIELAVQMVAHTNSLLDAVKQKGGIESSNVAEVQLDMQKFPGVAEYFREASLAQRDRLREYSDSIRPDIAPQDPTGKDSLGVSWWDPLQAAYQNCGCWWNPLPTRAAPWVSRSSSNPAATLRSWGYHSTPSFAGGGYTRAQTHVWWICGFGTFRDHAVISGTTQFREQNYAGWRPRGEPNPEVYASGPWPYALWPSYVSWWHQTH